MLRFRLPYLVLMLVAALCPFSASLEGQRTTADVLGTVTDASGAVLPNVKVTVHNLDTGADFTAESDKSGDYAVTQFPVEYAVAINEFPKSIWSFTWRESALPCRGESRVHPTALAGCEQT